MTSIIYRIILFIFRQAYRALLLYIIYNLILFFATRFFFNKNRNILLIINYLLENMYIEDINLNDELSNKILFKYLKSLDNLNGIQYFTQKDIIDIKSKYNNIIDDNLKKRDLKFSKEIFDLFKKRINERNKEIEDMLKEESTINLDEETIDLKEKKHDFKQDYENYWNNEDDRKLNLRKFIKFNTLLYDDNSKLINNSYQNFTDDQIFSLVLNSYLYYLDPHTNYLSSNILNPEKKFGLGVIIKKNSKGEILIDRVFPGGPAFKAGLESGDVLISVTENGKETFFTNYSIEDTANVILGEEGTEIIIKVKKINDDIKDYNIIRGPIDFNRSEILTISNKKVGFIKFISFDQNSSEFVRKSLDNLIKKNIDGLVIDIRDNGGGLLTEVIKILDMFIDTGIAIKYLDQNEKENKKYISNDMIEPGKLYYGPLTILINSNSASASEVLAGVIQYYKRGLVVGTSETTFGKGLIQTAIPLLNNNIFKFTSASYHLPNGISPQFIGIKSDVVIYDDLETRLKTDFGYEKFLPNVTQTSDIDPSDIELDNSFNNLEDIKKYEFQDKSIINEINKCYDEFIILENKVKKLYEAYPLNKNKFELQNQEINKLEAEKYNIIKKAENIIINKVYPNIEETIDTKNFNENILPWYLSGILTLQIRY